MPHPRALLRRYGLRPKRSWGQNFLTNLALAERMADEVCAASVDLVVELGAGVGTLTTALARRVNTVVAVERDPDLLRVLEAERDAGRLPEGVEIVGADAARLDYAALLGRARRAAMVGNLPYQITGRILRRTVAAAPSLVVALFMVQREVAERLVAAPGSRDYGVATVMTQAYLDPEILWKVSPGSFHPRPKVASAVVRLTPSPSPRAAGVSEQDLARVVHAAFAARRKTLLNTLGAVFGKERVRRVLESLEISGAARAENLAVEQLATLARKLSS